MSAKTNRMIFTWMGGEITDGIVIKLADKYPQDIKGYSADGFIDYHNNWNSLMTVLDRIEKDKKILITIHTTYVMIGGPTVMKRYTESRLTVLYAAIVKWLISTEKLDPNAEYN